MNLLLHKVTKVLILLFLMGSITTGNIKAQQSNLSPHQKTNWVAPAFTGIATPVTTASGHTGTGWANATNITDTNINNSATLTLVSRRTDALSGCSATNATGSVTIGNSTVQYNGGNYVAMVTGNPEEFASVSLATSMDGTTFTNVTGQTTAALSGGRYEIGGLTTATYRYLRLTVNLSAPPAVTGCGTTITRTLNIYNALQVTYGTAATGPCNQRTVLSRPFYNLAVTQSGALGGLTVGSVTNAANVIANNEEYANISYTLSVLGRLGITVRDNSSTYGAGSYLGFRIQNVSLANLSVLNNVILRTFLNGTLQETRSGSQLLVGLGLLGSSTPFDIGFVTTLPANEIQIEVSNPAGISLGTTRVYNPVFRHSCESPAFAANAKTYLTLPTHPVFVDKTTSGILGVGLGGSINDLDAIVDNDPNNYASFGTGINLSNDVHISVKKALDSIPAGTYAGFDIGRQGLLNTSILGNIHVATFKNGVLRESTATNASLLSLNTTVLNGNGRQLLGFRTTQDFNEVRLIINQGIGASLLSEMRIYGVVLQRFEAGPALSCNTLTNMTSPLYPVFIDGRHTSNSGLIDVGVANNNAENVIDNNPNNFASLDMTLAVGATTTFAVSDAVTTYNANSGDRTYVAFRIRTSNLVDASVLSAMSIQLIRPDGTLSSGYSPSLLAGVDVLGGEQSQYIGVTATEPFIGATLVINNTVGLGLGTLRIQGLAFQRLCSVPLVCNQSVLLQNGTHPVTINNARSGTAGLGNASLLGSDIANLWNVVDGNISTAARITKTLGVFSRTSISVENPVDEYPIGAIAGFIVAKSSGILEGDLLSNITIKTYNNGLLQESSASGSLINLQLLGINIIGSGVYNLGLYTTKPFDEIQLEVNDIIGAGTDHLDVYSAFVDTRFVVGGGLFCLSTSPDFGSTNLNQQLTGNVSTNDKVPPGVTYSLSAGNAGNPSSVVPTFNPDGSYTFTAATAGRYEFEVSVCLAGQLSGCSIERLVITVIDPTSATNIPIVNDDASILRGSNIQTTSVEIDVLRNDSWGNPGGNLGTPYIAAAIDSPGRGSVSILPSGRIAYFPEPGFYGVDVFTYTVCETPSGICRSATVKITVLAADAPNTTLAVDDHIIVGNNTPHVSNAANGLLANDIDPEGDIITVVPVSETMPGQGTLEIDPDGSYSFTPVTGFEGPVQFIYQIEDNGTPTATALGTLHILVKDAAALPAILSNFKVFEKDCKEVEIEWETAKEINLSHFEIQYSNDAKEFITTAKVPAAHTDGGKYRLSDFQRSSIGFYRLRMVDHDMRSQYSGTEKLMHDCMQNIGVSPNPTSGIIRVENLKGNETIIVHNLAGQKQIEHQVGSATEEIDLHSLPAGIYNLTVTDNGITSRTFKIVKQ